mgnify:CR=1 FL=1
MKIALSPKEEIIMNLLWEHGPMFVNEMLECYDEPRPHFNTVSTFVRGLEKKGLIAHNSCGISHQYYAAVSPSACPDSSNIIRLISVILSSSGLIDRTGTSAS